MCILTEHRNQNETLTQNYRRLGLTARLNAPTGGSEQRRDGEGSTTKKSTDDLLAIANARPKTQLEPKEVRVERDPETGRILRVIRDDDEIRRQARNPLHDPLNDCDTETESEADVEEAFAGFDDALQSRTDVVRQLEAQAARAAPKRPRGQSEREREWIARLVAKWGDDYGKMARDKKLNVMQQTEADIQRRVLKWRGRPRES